MSFLIKKLFRKYLQKYLSIQDVINLQKGQLQLPFGHLNHKNINKIFVNKNIPITIAYSQYLNLTLSIPIIQILSKPILIKIDTLRVVVLVQTKASTQQTSSTSDSQQVQNQEKQQQTQQIADFRQQKQSPSKSQTNYLKSLVNRLLSNLQIQIKKLQIIIRYGHKYNGLQSNFTSIDNHQYKFCLEGFLVKNSVLLFEGNLIKKIGSLGKITFTVKKFGSGQHQPGKIHSKFNNVGNQLYQKQQQFSLLEIADLNMCLNVDCFIISVICLVQKIKIGIQIPTIGWAFGLFNKKNQYLKKFNNIIQKNKNQGNASKNIKCQMEKQKSQRFNLQSMQLKITSIAVSLFDIDKNTQTTSNILQFSISNFQLNKQSKNSPNHQPFTFPEQPLQHLPSNSQLSIDIHTLSILCRCYQNNQQLVNQQILLVDMSEKIRKMGNVLEERDNKNKKKQVRLLATIIGMIVDKVDIYDVAVKITISKDLITFINRAIQCIKREVQQYRQLFNKKSQKQITKSQQQLQSKSLQQQNKQPATSKENSNVGKQLRIPKISATNMKLQLIVNFSTSQDAKDNPNHSHKISLKAQIPQILKISFISSIAPPTSSNSFSVFERKIVFQVAKLKVILNNRCELLQVNGLKLSNSLSQIKTNNNDRQIKQQNEIVLSIQNIQSNADVSIIADIKYSIKGNIFKDFINKIQKCKEEAHLLMQLIQKDMNKRRNSSKKKSKIPPATEYKELAQQTAETGDSNIPIIIIKQQFEENIQNIEIPQIPLTHTAITTKIYLRIHSFTISIGCSMVNSHIKFNEQSQTNSHLCHFNPTIIIQLQSIKCMKLIQSFSAKMTIKSLTLISPHNLSSSCMLKSAVQIKVNRSWSQLNKNQKKKKFFTELQNKQPKQSSSAVLVSSTTSIENSLQPSTALPQEIKTIQYPYQNNSATMINNDDYCSLTVLTPLHLDIQQQHIFLIAGLIKVLNKQNIHNDNTKNNQNKKGIFCTIENTTKQNIIVQYNINQKLINNPTHDKTKNLITNNENTSKTSLSTKLQSNELTTPQQMQNNPNITNNNPTNIKNNNNQYASWSIHDPMLTQHLLKPNYTEQLYLFDTCIRISINGQVSLPICLEVPNKSNKQQNWSGKRLVKTQSLIMVEPELDEIKENTQVEGDSSSQGVTKNSELLPPKLRNTHSTIQKPAKPPSSFSYFPQSQSHQPSHSPFHHSLPQNPTYLYQIPITFDKHMQHTHILQINCNNAQVSLNIQYRYQLHLFDQMENMCKFNYVQVRSIKFDKFQQFVRNKQYHQQHSNNNFQQIKNSLVLAMDWELLDQDKIQYVSFIIQTQSQQSQLNKNVIQQYKLQKLITNSIKYKMYGLYPVTKDQGKSTNNAILCNVHYSYYILQHVEEQLTSSSTHHYYLMPFLVMVNKLQAHKVFLDITNKKSSSTLHYQLIPQKYHIPICSNKIQKNEFDYYMKQYMIKLQIFAIQNQHQNCQQFYQSQQHYFNTFFMVDQAFENVIQLRNNVYNSKRYVRIRQSFLYKTKILQIYDCLNILNTTPWILQISIIPTNIYIKNKNNNNNNTNNIQKYTIQSKNQINLPIKLKKDDKIVVAYLNNKQPSKEYSNSIQIPVNKLYQNNNKLLLSYNFCRIQQPLPHQQPHLSNKQQEQYYQILVKMQAKSNVHHSQNQSYNPSNLQIKLIFSPFIYFTNLCSRQRQIRINGKLLQSCYKIPSQNITQLCYTPLCLPSNTNKDYNNRYMGINCQQIYDDLFVHNKSWITEGNCQLMQIQLIPLQGNNKMVKQKKKQSIISFNQLITHKIIQHNRVVYCLAKSFKQSSIELFLSDQLYASNIPLKYYIFNNKTDQYFLMNFSATNYAKCLLFPNQLQDEQNKDKIKNKDKFIEKEEQAGKGNFKKGENKIGQGQTKQTTQQINIQQKQAKNKQEIPQKQKQQKPKNQSTFDTSLGSKVHIQGKSQYPLNVMLNKDKHDIFLCDSQYRKLDPISLRKLQKLKIKKQKCQIQNFTILSLQHQNQSEGNPQFQLSVGMLVIKLTSKRKKISVINQVKGINLRCFSSDKIDLLIQNINLKVAEDQQQISIHKAQGISTRKLKQQLHPILRIPQQSYLIIEAKPFEDKLMFVKNVYMQCKIIDLHVNKQLLNAATYFSKMFKIVSEQIGSKQDNQIQEKNPHSHNLTQIKKILQLVRQKLLLIHSVYFHPINLCLTVQTHPSLDFSNIITLPEYKISSNCFKMTSLVKQISNHYLTNVIAKFPKLSFIYQNLRSPISMIKSILQTRDILAEHGRQQQKRKIIWSLSYIDLQRKYFPPISTLSSEKRISNFLTNNQKKNEQQFDKINKFLLQLSLDNSPSQSNQQQFICPLKNVIQSNISKLSQMTNITILYYLTNRNIRIISTHFPCQLISLKQIQSIKITRYKKRNSQIVISFKKKGSYLKICNQFLICHHLIRYINQILS